MNFSQLTSDEIATLHGKIQNLEPMDMKLFNKKLRLFDENYPWTLPYWAILGRQIISGAFILTEIMQMVWFCLKHRKNMITLLKVGFPVAKRIQDDPKTIEHLVQQAGKLVTNLIPPTPPPRPPTTPVESTIPTSKSVKNIPTISTPTTSVNLAPSSTTCAHQCTLEFITEAAQELYAKRQLHAKPYAGYLKEKYKKVHTIDSDT